MIIDNLIAISAMFSSAKLLSQLIYFNWLKASTLQWLFFSFCHHKYLDTITSCFLPYPMFLLITMGLNLFCEASFRAIAKISPATIERNRFCILNEVWLAISSVVFQKIFDTNVFSVSTKLNQISENTISVLSCDWLERFLYGVSQCPSDFYWNALWMIRENTFEI